MNDTKLTEMGTVNYVTEFYEKTKDMQKLNCKKEVVKLLNMNEHYRESSRQLLVGFWFDEIKDSFDITKISAFDFLMLLKKDKLTHPENIIRMKRKIQEINK